MPSFDARAYERQQREKSARTRRILTIVAAVLVVAALGVGGYALYTSDVLKIRTVDVSGNKALDDSTIVKEAKIPPDATFLRVPIGEIEANLKDDPKISTAKVSRSFPSTLRIEVVERTPTAVVSIGGSRAPWVISNDGYWLEQASAEESSTMLPITGVLDADPKKGKRESSASVNNALDVFKGISPELRRITAQIDAESVEKTEIITKDGVAIFIGPAEDLETKSKVALSILKQNPGKVVYINVRVPGTPTWRGKTN